MIGDPIEFELLKNSLLSIADEMALTIFRTTYSGVLKDNMDYSTAIFDGAGNLAAQGLTLPGHLGSMPTAMAAFGMAFAGNIAEGDVFEHEKTYGHRAGIDEPVELVTLKAIGRGIPEIPRAALAATAALPEGIAIANPLRRAYFGPAIGWRDTAVINRADLATPRAGPCIIEEYDSTCIVPPGAAASLDRFGNIAIALGAGNGE